MNTTPTTEDRIWAILAHLSALSFGMGVLLPIIGWSDQRRKSNYASFQSLQALGYQSLGFTIWVLSYLLIIMLTSIVLLVSLGSRGSLESVSPTLLIIVFILLLGFFAVYLLLPMVAALACALGKDFRYPIMGNRLARYLGYEPSRDSEDGLYEDHELRWVVAMGHFSILILLWGMLAPLTAWMLQGRHSLFLKFQSIQTLVYQAVTTIIYFVGGFLYLLGFIFLLAAMGGIGEPNLNSSMGIVGIVIFGISLLISFVLILFVPLLHILGQWAGYRVLKGDNYLYPLIGRVVERWISKNSTIEEKSA
ncbi:MAG TPA: DUF4870 domain-containing protein [Anaerolineales bacterium]|nr:DUF4870 domain-containing protein [Anaerolineales bacterium]